MAAGCTAQAPPPLLLPSGPRTPFPSFQVAGGSRGDTTLRGALSDGVLVPPCYTRAPRISSVLTRFNSRRRDTRGLRCAQTHTNASTTNKLGAQLAPPRTGARAGGPQMSLIQGSVNKSEAGRGAINSRVGAGGPRPPAAGRLHPACTQKQPFPDLGKNTTLDPQVRVRLCSINRHFVSGICVSPILQRTIPLDLI